MQEFELGGGQLKVATLAAMQVGRQRPCACPRRWLRWLLPRALAAPACLPCRRLLRASLPASPALITRRCAAHAWPDPHTPHQSHTRPRP